MRGRPIGRPTIPGYISEQEQAKRCGVTPSTLRRWRSKGFGPRAVLFGRIPMYRDDANERYLAQEEAAAEALRQARRRGRANSVAGGI